MNTDRIVEIDYTNHRGERRLRRIIPQPQPPAWENSEWHPETQWVLYALDVDKGEVRGFAVKDIHSWKPYVEKPADENDWLKHCRHGNSCYRHGQCMYGCPVSGHPKLQAWMREEAAKTMSMVL